MALRTGGLLRALEKGLGRPKGNAPNTMFAHYVQGLEQRAATATPAEAAALKSAVEEWQYCVESVERYKSVLHAGGVWSEVDMKDRVRVNAARVGLVMQESSKEAVSESFKNTPRGGHQDAGEAGVRDGDRTATEAAQQMREGKGSGILGGSGVA